MLHVGKAILAAGLAIVGAQTAFAQEAVELRFGVQTPPQVHYNKELFVPWAEKVAGDSEGTLNVTMFFAGTLGKEGQFVDLVESGAADIALDVAAYYPGRFALSDVASLPLLVKGATQGSEALWTVFEEGKFGNQFDGLKMLAVSTPPAATVLTTEKKVTVPEDMNGLKIAGGGKIKGAMIDAVGAAPVDVKIFELYQSLDRNVVDGAMTYYTAIPPFKLNEVAKHYLDVPLGGSFMMVFMSQEKFDSLPDAAKKAIEMNSGMSMSRAFGEVWDRAQQVGRKMATDAGGTISEPSEEQMEAWVAVFQPIVDDWAASVEGGKEVVEALKSSLD